MSKKMSVWLMAAAICIVAVIFTQPRVAEAQVGADYYLPLQVGNLLVLHTDGNSWEPGGYAARIISYYIDGTDSISGKLYYRKKGEEMADDASFNNIFIVEWLRKDSVGNVAIGAYSTTGSSNIDSATIIPDSPIFPNEYLTVGYTRSYPDGDNIWQDSVISTTETVIISPDTFINCLEIRGQLDSSGTILRRDYSYYAYGIGLVKNVRTIPDSEAHIEELVIFYTFGVEGKTGSDMPKVENLKLKVTGNIIQYQVPQSGMVRLKAYNLLGQEVRSLVGEFKTAGNHEISWNGRDESSRKVSSGVYIVQLQSGNQTASAKMIVVR